MRKNQVTIQIKRFGDQVPVGYSKGIQEINVYTDSNNLFEALSAAFAQVLEEVRKYESVPGFGCMESTSV
jgi:hypothetical protein